MDLSLLEREVNAFDLNKYVAVRFSRRCAAVDSGGAASPPLHRRDAQNASAIKRSSISE